MTSRVIVEMPLCTNRTVIEATARGDGTVDIRIESGCSHVQDYAEALKEAGPDDLVRLSGSPIIALAEEHHLTPTCLVPVAVYNACWVEIGMISRSLAKKNPEACIVFDL